MKKILALLLCVLLLTGCAGNSVAEAPVTETTAAAVSTASLPLADPNPASGADYISRFDSETTIVLSDEGITVNGSGETDTVYSSHDIIYYEDRDTYDSGNPYGEGTESQRHTAEEAAAHTVVNITAPGAYRISGTLSAGQIRVDLGNFAYEDPDAVVELILDNASITCTVAPAILFLNTYECDGQWSADTAKPDVDTSAAGANLILEGENTVNGSHVARIYKDADGEKKLWKQDGAIYSYMSLNVFGPGSLTLTANNEGLDTELHLTINGGNITILSDNDGINTNEDGVSVTTINGGLLHITAGLGAEGDGIDSNGYLVINGGVVFASANPGADAGMDSDMGSYIHGGTVLALGSTMDWAESGSEQVTMNLQFASHQQSDSLVITRTDGTVVFAYTPVADSRSYTGAILSSPNLVQGQTYCVYSGGTLSGFGSIAGLILPADAGSYTPGTQLAYTSTNVSMIPGGMGGGRGQMSGNFAPENAPEDFGGQIPTMPEGEMPEGFDPENMPEGFGGQMPTMPEGEIPEDFNPENMPQDGQGGGNMGSMPGGSGEPNTEFTLTNIVNRFSGITVA